MSKNTVLRRILSKLKKIFIILFIAQLLYIILLKWVDPPITITQLVSVIEGNGLKRDYVPMAQISRNARLAIIASEDQLFPDHNGFDVKSIEKVLTQGSKKSGKSGELLRSVSKWQRMSFCGKDEAGSGKVSRHTLLL
jgi:monofunctional biosynthetic peptidoglycan transglycosylase